MKKINREIEFQNLLPILFSDEIKDESIDDNKTRVGTITFQVTENCNLACTYCYQHSKSDNKMTFEVAKKVCDMFFDGELDAYIGDDLLGMCFEFIGGEPFLEVELIEKICDYISMQMIFRKHPLRDRYIFNICSNGVLYEDPKVQHFLEKYHRQLSFSITVDGTKRLHDSCRIFKDGSGSYDLAHSASLDWMKKGYKMGSKITLAPQNIMFFSDCVIKMIDDGYTTINANFVFEDVWNIEAALLFYKEAKELSDFLNVSNLKEKVYLSIFDDIYGAPNLESDNRNYCGGTGAMLSVDYKGRFFPCIRYMESSLNGSQPPYFIGDIHNGILYDECTKECVRCLNKITRRSQSEDKCFYCPISKGCAWCSAFNYEVFGTANKRATFICDMHKARVLATCYYWNSYYKKENLDEHYDLWVPRVWAEPIIGKEEYNYLVSLTKEQGGFVNESDTMIKLGL